AHQANSTRQPGDSAIRSVLGRWGQSSAYEGHASRPGSPSARRLTAEGYVEALGTALTPHPDGDRQLHPRVPGPGVLMMPGDDVLMTPAARRIGTTSHDGACPDHAMQAVR
ncbi:MAG: hypothetical protein U1D69_13770, partial [Polynucleobacter sp.]|nr:hypothetical protein [Polynucleobacter sp.]